MKKTNLGISLLLMCSSYSTLSAQVQVLEPETRSLLLEIKSGDLYGSFTNKLTLEQSLTRVPTSAFENFNLFIIRPQTADTLQLSEFSFLHTGQQKLNATFYRYDKQKLFPLATLPLFKINLTELEKTNWNNTQPTPKNQWIKSNRFPPGTYQIYYSWSNGGLIRQSNAVLWTVPHNK